MGPNNAISQRAKEKKEDHMKEREENVLIEQPFLTIGSHLRDREESLPPHNRVMAFALVDRVSRIERI